jgi:predicted amino acid racemase
MNNLPRVLIDITKIVHNYRKINEHCIHAGVTLTGVVKGIAGDCRIIGALIEAGLIEIGDSRLENLAKIKSGCPVHKMLLRLPALSRLAEVVQYSDISLNTEIAVLETLNQSAGNHQVFLMVDLGDRREGVLEEDLLKLASQCLKLKNIHLQGLGTNFSCFAGVMPSRAKLDKLVALAQAIEGELGVKLDYVSGGNSSSLPLLYSGKLPTRINHLRIGEGILLGRETLTGNLLPELFDDAFIVEAEIIQAQWKPADPDGETGLDAFGRKPELPKIEAGIRLLVNLGHQDTPLTGLTPLDPRLTVMGGSSDYLVMASDHVIKVGEVVRFLPNYWSLLGLMTSPYVEKVYI